MEEEFSVIIYHAGCPDGATAAAIAQRKNPKARLYPLANGKTVTDITNESIVMVDISVPAGNLRDLASNNRRVLVLDHHETALRGLAEFTKPKQHVPGVFTPAGAEVQFDMKRSGAGLAWDYFFPGAPRPLFVDYIEDHDLWLFKLSFSRVIRTAFSTKDFRDVSLIWDSIERFPVVFDDVVEAGIALLEYQENVLFPQMARAAFRTTIGNHSVVVCPCTVLQLVSEFGDWLVKRYSTFDYILLWDERTLSDFERKCMLRSNGRVNVAHVAESYGGGGHAGAAGFTVSLEEFKQFLVGANPKIE